VQPILQTRGLAKQYRRGVWALRGIDLAIPRGGMTALIGPNAAGKSTLIKTWVGFEQPTRGSALVAGVDASRDPAAALEHIGYVPQRPALYDGLSVEDHVDLASLLRPGFDRAAARQRLDLLGIARSELARNLSGGQQTQVVLALALGTRAEVLLLDEPLASLDPLARREFLHLLVDVVRTDGVTALLSSHNVTDVQQACDRLIILGVGQVLLHSSVADALATHGVSVAGETAERDVATFAGPTGERVTLLHDGGERAATFEEIVLGYLSSARAVPERDDQA
jgi:ABC-2 type transport system ATP-binding protein